MKAKTKAKIQLIIGLLTAIVCVTGILICLLHPTSYKPSCILLSGLIFPIAYGAALIRKKLITAKIIFFIWCGGWLLSCVLLWFVEVAGMTRDISGAEVCAICAVSILELTVIIPLWIPLSSSFVYSLGVRAVSGAVFMVLFWIGIRGLKQTVEAEDEAMEGY